jgi:hypothetical protein
MEQIVRTYIDTFDSEVGAEIIRTFNLLIDFDYPNLDDDFVNILMDENAYDSITMRDTFIMTIRKKQEYFFCKLQEKNL